MGSRLSRDGYLKRAIGIHGDKYDYSKTVYTKGTEKIIITCKLHGDFSLDARRHTMDRQGCPSCASISRSKKIKNTTKQFIDAARVTHGERYCYKNTKYVGSTNKLTVGCKIHGDYEIIASNHLAGSGCRVCGTKSRKRAITKTTKDFIAESESLHGKRYCYKKSKYVKFSEKLTVTCRKHGDFNIRPSSHASGSGCPKCGRENSSKGTRKNKEYFITKSLEKHGNRYDYSKSIYKGSRIKIDIICNLHGVFNMMPYAHMSGQGCKECALLNRGYNRSKFVGRCEDKNSLGLLYIIRCYDNKEEFFKVGIASTGVEDRFNCKNKMPYSYEVIKELSLEPKRVYDLENHILRSASKFRYKPMLSFKGETECFSQLRPILSCLKDYLK